ncbi:MAG: M28 family peptidase [Longimicrobiales bacterium]|nr:M28 family peptidase [Longimicrobiales bacterium]
MTKRPLPPLALALLPLLLACGDVDRASGGVSDAERDAAIAAALAEIDATDLFEKVSVLAADSMRGRFTPSPELEATARWIASRMQAAGLEPGAADGTYIHRYTHERFGEGQTAPNVVAILPGSDPGLAGEYVVYSAHMDHVGVREPEGESTDSIWNGADDNASGTSTLIEVAEAMASMDPEARPRRSMLFLWVSGEERGLLGSAAFASDPSVPLESIVADFNVDMVGRNWTDTIVAIGKEHSDLGATMNRVNAANPEIGMTAIDDLWPDENFYRRSDHFNFARRGVPVLFFFNGTHEDYHEASDEVEKIDTGKMARIGRLLFLLGLEVGNADARPQWDPESRAEIVEDTGATGAPRG